MGQWRKEGESSGARFYGLLPPRAEEHRADRRIFNGFEVGDLWGGFQSYGDLSRFFFVKDGHWNELGNLYAAVHLYERLARALGVEMLPRERLEEALLGIHADDALPHVLAERVHDLLALALAQEPMVHEHA